MQRKKHRRITYEYFSDISVETEYTNRIPDIHSDTTYGWLKSLVRIKKQGRWDKEKSSIVEILHDSVERSDMVYLQDNYLELMSLHPMILTRAFMHIVRKGNMNYETMWRRLIGVPTQQTIICSYGLYPHDLSRLDDHNVISGGYDFYRQEGYPYDRFKNFDIPSHRDSFVYSRIGYKEMHVNALMHSTCEAIYHAETGSIDLTLYGISNVEQAIVSILESKIRYGEEKLDETMGRGIQSLTHIIANIFVRNGNYDHARTVLSREMKCKLSKIDNTNCIAMNVLISNRDGMKDLIDYDECSHSCIEKDAFKLLCEHKKDHLSMICNILASMKTSTVYIDGIKRKECYGPWYLNAGCYDWYGIDESLRKEYGIRFCEKVNNSLSQGEQIELTNYTASMLELLYFIAYSKPGDQLVSRYLHVSNIPVNAYVQDDLHQPSHITTKLILYGSIQVIKNMMNCTIDRIRNLNTPDVEYKITNFIVNMFMTSMQNSHLLTYANVDAHDSAALILILKGYKLRIVMLSIQDCEFSRLYREAYHAKNGKKQEDKPTPDELITLALSKSTIEPGYAFGRVKDYMLKTLA